MCAENSDIPADKDNLVAANYRLCPPVCRMQQQHELCLSSSSFSVYSVSRSASTFGHRLIRDVLCTYPDQPLLYSFDRLLHTLGGPPRTDDSRKPPDVRLLYERNEVTEFGVSSPETSPLVRSSGNLLSDDRPGPTAEAANNKMDNQVFKRPDSNESCGSKNKLPSLNAEHTNEGKTSVCLSPKKRKPIAMTPSDRSIAREIWTVILENVLDEIQSRYDMHLKIGAYSRSSMRHSADGLAVTSRQVDSIVSDVLNVLRAKSEVDLKKSSKVVLTSRESVRSKSAVEIGDRGDIILNSQMLSSIINGVLDTVDTRELPKISSSGKSRENETNWTEDTLFAVVVDVVRDRMSNRTFLKRCVNNTSLISSIDRSSTKNDEQQLIGQITKYVISRIISKSKRKIDGNTVVSALKCRSNSMRTSSNNPARTLSVYFDGGMLIDMQSLNECVDTHLNRHFSRQRVTSPGKEHLAPSNLTKPPLYLLREIEAPLPSREARLIQQEYTIARINTFDDDSQVVEIVRPNDAPGAQALLMTDARATGDNGGNLDALFAVLPDRTTVCFAMCDQIKT